MIDKYKLTYHFRNGKKFTVRGLTKTDLNTMLDLAKKVLKENLNGYQYLDREARLDSTVKNSWIIRFSDVSHVTYRKLLWGFL